MSDLLDPYTDKPTHVRVFSDGHEWFIDGATDDKQQYTESCWSYDSWAAAIADVPDFIEKVATYGGVTWAWRTK